MKKNYLNPEMDVLEMHTVGCILEDSYADLVEDYNPTEWEW